MWVGQKRSEPCSFPNDPIQVFSPDGELVSEAIQQAKLSIWQNRRSMEGSILPESEGLRGPTLIGTREFPDLACPENLSFPEHLMIKYTSRQIVDKEVCSHESWAFSPREFEGIPNF